MRAPLGYGVRLDNGRPRVGFRVDVLLRSSCFSLIPVRPRFSRTAVRPSFLPAKSWFVLDEGGRFSAFSDWLSSSMMSARILYLSFPRVCEPSPVPHRSHLGVLLVLLYVLEKNFFSLFSLEPIQSFL